MKFITEADLRAMYRKSPFTTYEPEPETRLTPGARQFLNDRNIRFQEEQPTPGKWGIVYAKASEKASGQSLAEGFTGTEERETPVSEESGKKPEKKQELSRRKNPCFAV